jgi:putative ABC transport system permease protein
MRGGFYLRYALRTLGRDRRRTGLALICIAFGVMALVALQSLAALFVGVVVLDPRLQVGGDLRLSRQGQPLSAAAIADLDRLQASGALARYTLIADSPARFLKPAGTGHVHQLIGATLAVDPAAYPLLGRFVFRDSALTLAQALAGPDDAVITRDVAQTLGLTVGDRFSLSGAPGSTPATFRVSAVADDTPRHQGDSVFYSLATARRLSRESAVATDALALRGPGADPGPALHAAGWDVFTVTDIPATARETANLFNLLFKGAGILGLIISGIGVANTLQVLFARRTHEIAVLKTLGYRQATLLGLFGLETGLLGLAGSLLGAVAGVGLAAALVALTTRTLALLLTWAFDGGAVLGGLGAGIATTLVFGTVAVVRASGARPAVLFRDQPEAAGRRAWLPLGGLLGGLAAIFTAVSSVILGSPVQGAGLVGGALAGSLALGAMFGASLFVVGRVPVPRGYALVLAQRSLNRGRGRAIFPLIALAVGVFTIGLATMGSTQAQARVAGQGIDLGGANLYIYARRAEVPAVQAALAAQGVPPAAARYETAVRVTDAEGRATDGTLVQGRDLALPLTDLAISRGPAWGTAADGVYVYQGGAPAGAQPGDRITLTAAAGQTVTLPMVGTYGPAPSGEFTDLFLPFQGLLVSQATAARLGDPETQAATVIATVPPERLAGVSDRVGRAVPTTTVISRADANDALLRIFRDLLTLALAVAGLALVAGAILIANAVGLALVERRREIGILKALGYRSGQVLATVMVEQGGLGVIGGAAGLAGVAVAIRVINELQPRARLVFDVPQAGLLLAITTGGAALAAAAVAWHPTRVPVLAVLRAGDAGSGGPP